jgi:hypothetical protein
MEPGFSVGIEDLAALGAALAEAGDTVEGAAAPLDGHHPDAGASTDEVRLAIGAVGAALLRSAAALHSRSAAVQAAVSTYENADTTAVARIVQAE